MSRTRHHHHRRMSKNGPAWFRHMFTEVPQRRRNRAYEHQAVMILDLEDLGPAWDWKKPQWYYW